MWMLFAYSAFVLFWVQFFVPRGWKWRAVISLNAAAWAILIVWMFTDSIGTLTAKGLFKVLSLFGVFAMIPFFLRTLVGTFSQLMVTALFNKLLQHK